MNIMLHAEEPRAFERVTECKLVYAKSVNMRVCVNVNDAALFPNTLLNTWYSEQRKLLLRLSSRLNALKKRRKIYKLIRY